MDYGNCITNNPNTGIKQNCEALRIFLEKKI